MHPRITIHENIFPRSLTLEQTLGEFTRAAAPRIGLRRVKFEHRGWARGIEAVQASGLDVTHLVHGPLFTLEDPSRLDDDIARLIETLEAATELGARCVYGVTGSATSSTWEQAAEAFVAGAASLAPHLRHCPIPLLVEPANHLFADIGFVHTLRDAVDVAQSAGIGVCVDVQHCWPERGLRETIARAVGNVGLVQLSDFIPLYRRGTFFRAVPGDGVVPLERIVSAVLEDGYEGLFDLELATEDGVDPAETIVRAADYIGTLLDRLGA